MRFLGPFGGPVNTLAVSADAYFQALIAQANAQREVAATDILERANNTMQGLADGISAQTQQLDDPGAHQWHGQGPSIPSIRNDIENGYLNVSPHAPECTQVTATATTGVRPAWYGFRHADGYDEGGPVNGRVMSSPRIPNEYITEWEVGSRLNPVTDPQDHGYGPTARGSTVIGITERWDIRPHARRPLPPLWNVNGDLVASQRLPPMGGAGVLGAGALGMVPPRGLASRNECAGAWVPPVPWWRSFGSGRPARRRSYSGPGYGTYKAPAAGGAGIGAGGTTAAPGGSAGSGKVSASEVLVRERSRCRWLHGEEPVPVALVVRTIRRSRRVASTRPSALTMMEMNCPRATSIRCRRPTGRTRT